MEVDSSNSTARIASAQSAASKAEREAAERVTKAQKHVREVTKEEEAQIQNTRDQYEKRTEVERVRGDDYIESVRNRSYENLTKLRRDEQSEETRVARKSEKELHDLNQHYSEATRNTVAQGEAKTAEASKKAFQAEQYQRQKGDDDLTQLKANYSIQKAQVDAERSNTNAAYTKATKENREQLEDKTRTAIENTTEHYNDMYEGAMKQNKDALADVNWRAARDVESLKKTTAIKLGSYTDQKTDPFYRMVDMKASLEENDQQFVLRAQIPPHERDRINVNIHGNEIVLSGKRKSEETIQVGEGHSQRTAAYQAFSENFPLGWPVDPKNMTREWEGDTLVVRVPKRSTYEVPKVKREVARASAERPNFPANLPTEKKLAQMNADAENAENAAIPPSKRKTGSTLA